MSNLFVEFPLRYDGGVMTFPIKTCVVCGEEFELRPNKPGFANRCYECSEEEAATPGAGTLDALTSSADSGLNAERRKAIRDMLYRNES
jgi:hypothetical protein